MIEGVYLKQLVTHPDERGYFRELIHDYNISQFGQLSHSMMETGVEKYGHIHQIQTDYWYIFPLGAVGVQLNDMREESDTFGQVDLLLFDGTHPAILTIPPGVAHGLKVFEGPAHLIYLTSHIYNPDDEGRIELDYDWSNFDVM